MADAAEQQDAPEQHGTQAKRKTLKRARLLSETKNWYADRYQSVRVQRNILFLFTLVLMGGIGLSVAMIARLTDEKVFEPYVVEIEEASGIVTTVSIQDKVKYTADQAIQRFHIVQYLQAREGYSAALYQQNFQKVRLMSDVDVYNEFSNSLTQADAFRAVPSPLNLRSVIQRRVSIKSITYLQQYSLEAQQPGRVQARLKLDDMDGAAVINTYHVIVTLDFSFRELELQPYERYINPIGFQVIYYSIEQEQINAKEDDT